MPQVAVNKSYTPSWAIRVEENYNARYVGYYDLPGRYLEYGAFYVFYQEQVPEKFKNDDRYDNYFAILVQYHGDLRDLQPSMYITGAKRIREAKFNAIEVEPGKFIVSRFHHDYVAHDQYMLDGGLAYCRYGAKPPTHYMVLEEGREVFYAIADDQESGPSNGSLQEQAEQADAGPPVPSAN